MPRKPSKNEFLLKLAKEVGIPLLIVAGTTAIEIISKIFQRKHAKPSDEEPPE
jgi:preprotein translocase subunit Sss1